MYLTNEQAHDKKLITELAGQIIGPIYDVQELRGRISFNYLINGKHVLKLPSHRTEPTFWKRQSRNLPSLQEQLKYQIPTPKVSQLTLGKKQVMGYCYPQIKGEVMTKSNFRQLSLLKKIAFFEKLSEVVEQLHKINPNILPEPLPSYSDALASLLSNNQAGNRIRLQDIENAFHQKGISLNKTSLCHLDLHAENIVLDDKNNIIGILDWDNLCLGETFMEFRTNLYKPSDLRILRNVYQQKTHQQINPEAFQCMDDLHKQMLGLFALGILTHRPTKWTTKVKHNPIHTWKHVLNKDTDRWASFGRN